jgi:hypothetical protein
MVFTASFRLSPYFLTSSGSSPVFAARAARSALAAQVAPRVVSSLIRFRRLVAAGAGGRTHGSWRMRRDRFVELGRADVCEDGVESPADLLRPVCRVGRVGTRGRACWASKRQ